MAELPLLLFPSPAIAERTKRKRPITPPRMPSVTRQGERLLIMKVLETVIALSLILGGAFLLAEIAANTPDTGYRPSRAEILTQCEQIADDALLERCFEAANKGRD